jgi:transcriptional activator SPT7
VANTTLGTSSSSSDLLQNLLRTLTENQVKPTPDLKLLLNTVKDARVCRASTVHCGHLTHMIATGIRHQGVRTILRVSRGTITRRSNSHHGACDQGSRLGLLPHAYGQDNHDAEAFLKPVSKSDYPDYYDGALSNQRSHSAAFLTRDVRSLCVTVVSNPMDFQTMLRKVKAKQYKSKREFKDDLDLIWLNCYTYNATEVSPLNSLLLCYPAPRCHHSPYSTTTFRILRVLNFALT